MSDQRICDREEAARQIQQVWRSNRTNRADVLKYLTPEARWDDATQAAQMKVTRDAAEEGRNHVRERWKRAAFLARRLQDPDSFLQGAGVEVDDSMKKFLETQHWLELVDIKHRYGSNLKFYHRRWQVDDTQDNFFKWLDRGAGKNLSLQDCPREQLEKERIIYLSSEQRLNYLVEIDPQGKLRWARNHELVDTTAGRWKDAGHGRGVVPFDTPGTADGEAASDMKPDGQIQRRMSFTTSGEVPPSPSIEDEAQRAAEHYYEPQGGSNPITAFFLNNMTLQGLTQKLLRKTVSRNAWMYVSDKHFNIFIGIKETGAFQHSSLVAGGVVTSAGLISVHEGLIHKLDPLSGHYRTKIEHFRRFIRVLNERGVDMHRAEISKAEMALWGIEKIKKFQKSQGRMMRKGKHGVAKAVSPHAWHEEASKWKREIIEGRKKHSQPEGGVEKCEEEKQSEKAKGKEKERAEDDAAVGNAMDQVERAAGGQDQGHSGTALEQRDWDVPKAEEGRDVDHHQDDAQETADSVRQDGVT